MAVQLAVSTRNARADAVESDVGADAQLAFFTGAQPANCAAADSGTEISRMTLPADWMAAASAGAKAKSGTWQDPAADAAGVIGHFRLYASDGTTCKMQGSCTESGGGGDMILQNTDVGVGQAITITSFGWTEPNP